MNACSNWNNSILFRYSCGFSNSGLGRTISTGTVEMDRKLPMMEKNKEIETISTHRGPLRIKRKKKFTEIPDDFYRCAFEEEKYSFNLTNSSNQYENKYLVKKVVNSIAEKMAYFIDETFRLFPGGREL